MVCAAAGSKKPRREPSRSAQAAPPSPPPPRVDPLGPLFGKFGPDRIFFQLTLSSPQALPKPVVLSGSPVPHLIHREEAFENNRLHSERAVAINLEQWTGPFRACCISVAPCCCVNEDYSEVFGCVPTQYAYVLPAFGHVCLCPHQGGSLMIGQASCELFLLSFMPFFCCQSNGTRTGAFDLDDECFVCYWRSARKVPVARLSTRVTV